NYGQLLCFRNTLRPFDVTLIHLQAFRIQNHWEIGTILRGKVRNAVIRGPGDEHGFALRKNRETVKRGRLITKSDAQRGRICGTCKRSALTFKSLEAIASTERKFAVLDPQPRPARRRFLVRLVLSFQVNGSDRAEKYDKR